LICSIGKCLGSDAQARGSASGEQRGTGQPEQDQRRVEGPDRARDRFSKPAIGSCHVVEGTVRLYVLKAHAVAPRHSGNGRNLVEDQVFGFARREAHLAPPETGQVLEARVRPDADAVRVREADRLPEDTRIACVEPRGDARRGHRREEGFIIPDSVCAVGFADVGVEIDAHRADKLAISLARRLVRRSFGGDGTSKSEGGQKTKGHHDTWCPPASPVWLPQHSRRPAVIRPATCSLTSQGVCLRNSSKVAGLLATAPLRTHDFVVSVTVL
jgi:hypothetical protein